MSASHALPSVELLSTDTEGDPHEAPSGRGASPGGVDLADTLSALASLCYWSGEYAESRSTYGKVLALQQQIYAAACNCKCNCELESALSIC